MSLDQVIAEYFASVARGESPQREQILSNNPEHAEALKRFFYDYDALQANLKTAALDSASKVDQSVEVLPSSEPPALTANLEQPLPEDSDDRSRVIGNYKLLQCIGSGGMGEVWMAEQEKPVRRRVALKLIKSGMDTKQVVARFEAERQALAMMDHQNIAKVLDAGTTQSGQPYFVMELVQGIPFNQYCDANKLSITDRLNLFVPVCNAIQHAHQKGVIHRDLKPSNILITLYDGKPVPKVIDFGLAKALQHQSKLTDKTLFTEFGQVVGTLQYMSPEQAEMNALDVDTRTDIYSLGVMLYELLTGSTPIEKDALQQQAVYKVLETIREKDPPRPSARLSSSGDKVTGISQQRQIDPRKLGDILRGDLDWIAMKALEKNRTRRYASASSFADDIQRFLTGDAIEARPPSTAYKVQKFVRKNKRLAAGAGIVIAVLFLGIIGTGYGLIEARVARNEALLRATDARFAKKLAESESLRSRKSESLAKEEADKAREAENSKERSLYRTRFHLAASRAAQGRTRDAKALLNSIPLKHRHIEWLPAYRIIDSSIGSWNFTNSCCFAISGDERYLAVLDYEAHVRLIDLQLGQLSSEFNIPAEFDDMIHAPFQSALTSLNADGGILAIAASAYESKESDLFIYETKAGTLIKRIAGDNTPIVGVAFTEDRSLLCLSESGLFRRIDLDTEVEIIRSNLTYKPLRLVCPPLPMSYVAVVTDQKTHILKVSDLVEYESVDSKSIALCQGGKLSVFLQSGQIVSASSTGPEAKLNTINKAKIASPSIEQHHCGVMAVSSSGGELICSHKYDTKAPDANQNYSLQVFDVCDGSLILTLSGHEYEIIFAKFISNGSRVISADIEGTIKVWALSDANEIASFASDDHITRRARFTVDGNSIIAGGSDETLKSWNIKSGQLNWEAELQGGAIRDFDFVDSRESCAVVCGGTSNLQFVSTTSGTTQNTVSTSFESLHSIKNVEQYGLVVGTSDGTVATIHDDSVQQTIFENKAGPNNEFPIYEMEYSPRASILAIANWGLKLVDLHHPSATLINTFDDVEFDKGFSEVQNIAISPRGSQIAIGLKSGSFTVFDITSGKVVFNDNRFINPRYRSMGSIDGSFFTGCPCTFTSDGARAITAGFRGSIVVWDASTWEELLTIQGFDQEYGELDAFQDIELSASEESLLTAAGDYNTVKLHGLGVAVPTNGSEYPSILTPSSRMYADFRWHMLRSEKAFRILLDNYKVPLNHLISDDLASKFYPEVVRLNEMASTHAQEAVRLLPQSGGASFLRYISEQILRSLKPGSEADTFIDKIDQKADLHFRFHESSYLQEFILECCTAGITNANTQQKLEYFAEESVSKAPASAGALAIALLKLHSREYEAALSILSQMDQEQVYAYQKAIATGIKTICEARLGDKEEAEKTRSQFEQLLNDKTMHNVEVVLEFRRTVDQALAAIVED